MRTVKFEDIANKFNEKSIKVLRFNESGKTTSDITKNVIAIQDISNTYGPGTVGIVLMNEIYNDGFAEYMANHVYTSHGSVLFIEDIISSVKLDGLMIIN